jgi:hypothetical protein
MNYKTINLSENELGETSISTNSNNGITILHFTNIECSKNQVENDNHWVNLLEVKNDFSTKLNIKIITYYITSDNQRKDDEQVKLLQKKCDWQLKIVSKNSEDIRNIVRSGLVRSSDELTCHRVFVLFKSGSQIKQIQNTYESSYDTYDIKRFLNDIIKSPEIITESLITRFDRFVRSLSS